MSGMSLSAVLEEKIKSLCLNDFPCGIGSWRKTESIDSLLDLLDCPRSPWWYDDDSWSPQVRPLRQLAVTKPERLNKTFIYSFFTILKILEKKVSVIDEGLLRFRKLEQLVLSSNEISEIPAENLPTTLKLLELRANQLSSLSSLTKGPPLQLQYLGLCSNTLGSHQDIARLTGRHWPELMTLDLSDCEFEDQRALLNALLTLPSLKWLMLKGNPFTLSPSYPGFAVDSLPELACLDTLWLLPDKRSEYRGMATMRDVIVDQASVTVTLGRLRGIPNVLMSKGTKTLRPPRISYFITYQFLSSPTPDEKLNIESQADTETTAHVREDGSNENEQQANKNCEGKRSREFKLHYETYAGLHLSQHSTSKLKWSEEMDFSDAQTYTVSSLRDLKKFLNQGLYLKLEEEKIPAKSTAEVVQNTPNTIMGSAHVPLQSLVQGGQRVNVLCNFDLLQKGPEKETTEKKKEDEASKQSGGSGAENMASSKAEDREKEIHDVEVQSDQSAPIQLEPVTVELCVELKRWQSASEAHPPPSTAQKKFKK